MDQLPRLGKRELICLLSFTCNYVVFVWRGFLFLWVLGMGYVILLWHSLSLPYNYFKRKNVLQLLETPLVSNNTFENQFGAQEDNQLSPNGPLDQATDENAPTPAK